MILPRSLLRLGRLRSLSPALWLSLSPLFVRILTESTVPLLSTEWGAREDLGVLVALVEWGVWVIIVPPPAVPPSPVSQHTPPTTMSFGPTTSLAQSQKRYLLSSSTVMGILHLLEYIPTSLHLWRIPLLTQFLRCVLCTVGIYPLRRLWTFAGATPPVVISAIPPAVVSSPPPAPSSSSSFSSSLAHLDNPSIKTDPFKLSEIKDVKSYLDMQDEIAYYLRSAEYSTRRSDALLITDPSNAEASRYWEGSALLSRMGGFAFCSRTLVLVFTARVLK